MDKDLALAFEFKNAPDDVKTSGEAYRDAWLRVEKAEVQSAKWNAEYKDALEAQNKTSAAFKQAVKNWDPSGSKGGLIEIKPEAPKVVSVQVKTK